MFRLLAKDILIYGILHVLSRMFTIFLLPVYARVFSAKEFALYDFLLSILSIIALIAALEVPSGMARYFYEAEKEESLKQLLGTAVILICFSSFVCFFSIWFLFTKYFNGYKGISYSLFIPVSLSILFYPMYNLITTFFRFQRNLFYYGVLSIGDMFLSAILSIFFIFILKTGVDGIFWSLLLSKVTFVSIGLILLKDYLPFSFSTKRCREILSYGVPLVPSVISGWLQNYANRFVLISTVSLSDMGTFSLGARIASLMMLVQMAFRMAWTPHAVKLMNKEGCEEIYAKSLRYYLIAMGSLTIMIILLSKELVLIFGGEKYKGASLILSLLAAGYLYIGSLSIIGLGNHIVKKTYYITFGAFAGTIVNVVFLYLTVYHLGIVAAGVSFVLGSITTFIIILLSAQKNRYIPYNYSHLFGITFIILLASGVALIVDKFNLNLFNCFLKIIIFVVIFVILVNLLCESREKREFKTMLNRMIAEVKNVKTRTKGNYL